MDGKQHLSQPWEGLYKDVLFEAELEQMPRRIELAKHAILDRLEDVTCARSNEKFEHGELDALRKAHRALRVLEELYLPDDRRDS
jgi:hypothetical protein